MGTLKICIECKHHRETDTSIIFDAHECTSPRRLAADPVTGEYKEVSPRRCAEQRTNVLAPNPYKCGPDGNWFEPK